MPLQPSNFPYIPSSLFTKHLYYFCRMKQFLLFLSLSVLLVSCNNTPEDASETQNSEMQQNTNVNPTQVRGSSPLDSLSNFIDANPSSAKAYAERANLYLQKRRMEFALLDVNKALALDSNVAKTYEVLGGIAYIQNKTRQAKNEWTRCIALDKNNVACRMALAELYIAVKNFEPAIKLLNEATALDDRNATAYIMKGVVSRDFSNDTALALNYFQKAVDLDQDNLDALDLMAVTLGNIGDTTAEFYYKRILRLDPNRPDVFYKMGVFYMKTNQANRALEAYTKAVQLNPADAQSYYNLGYMHLELRLYKQALDYFSKAITAKDRNFQAYYGRGYAYEMIGNPEAAKADYRKSLEILPIYEPAKESLARVLRTDAEVAAKKK